MQLELDACTLRAPFAGRLLAAPVSPGQYLAKGATVADLADVSSLRVLVPVDRASVSVGDALNLSIEGQVAAGKVQALLPLPENFAPLRELSTPLGAAWVVLPNTNGTFEPGQRALSPAIPTTPLATIPAPALQQPEEEGGTPTIQVIRNEYVTNIPVRVLGNPGPDRVQVTGPMRPTDALIVSSTIPLMAGTLIRFRSEAQEGIEATSPDPDESGQVAGITPPRVTPRTAPIGAPGSAHCPGARTPDAPPPGRARAPAQSGEHRRARSSRSERGHRDARSACVRSGGRASVPPGDARRTVPSGRESLPRFSETFRSSVWTRRPRSDYARMLLIGSPRRNGWARIIRRRGIGLVEPSAGTGGSTSCPKRRGTLMTIISQPPQVRTPRAPSVEHAPDLDGPSTPIFAGSTN